MEARDNKAYLLWIGIAAIAFLGAVMRVHGGWDRTFSCDDFDHLRWSGFDWGTELFVKSRLSLMEVIRQSFADAHPPLRNVILYFLMPIADSPNMLRLVAIIPGTLLIVTIPYLLQLLGFSSASIILSAIGIAFSPILIMLSIETRGYMLMLFLVSLYFIFLETYFRQPNYQRLFLCGLTASLAVATEYSAAFCIFSFGLAYLLVKRQLLTQRQLISFVSVGAIVAFIFAAQLYFLQLNDTYNVLTTRFQYLAEPLSAGIDTWPMKFVSSFYLFRPFALLEKLEIVFLLLFLFGILVSFFRKDYLIGCCALLPIVLLLFAAILEKYPFIAGRQCIFLQIPVVLGVMYGFDSCLRFLRSAVLRQVVTGSLGVIQLIPLITSPETLLNLGARNIESSILTSITTKVPQLIEGVAYIADHSSHAPVPDHIVVAWQGVYYVHQEGERWLDGVFYRNSRWILPFLKREASLRESQKKTIQAFDAILRKRMFNVLLLQNAWSHCEQLAKSMLSKDFQSPMERNPLLQSTLRRFGSKERFWLMPYVNLPLDSAPYPSSQIKRAIVFEGSSYNVTFHPDHFVFHVERHNRPELLN